MPGKLLKVNVKAGDEVRAGDIQMAAEAMKLETIIKAKSDGMIAELKFQEGGRWTRQTSSW